MSSEKYELAQDELDSLMEKIGADVRKTEMSSGEAKKRMVQVRERGLMMINPIYYRPPAGLYRQAGGRREVSGGDGV